jgi:hypothetical protein
MSPSNTVAQLYPQALGSLFVSFYDLQGYSGGILTGLDIENIKIRKTNFHVPCVSTDPHTLSPALFCGTHNQTASHQNIYMAVPETQVYVTHRGNNSDLKAILSW